MLPPRLRPAVLVLAVAGCAGLSGGHVIAGTTPPLDSGPPGDGPNSSAIDGAPPPECRDIVIALDAQYGLFSALEASDGATLARLLGSLRGLADAAQTSPPATIANDVALWLAPVDGVVAVLADVDLNDPDAVLAALGSLPEDESNGPAQEAVETWAADTCGWVADDPFADAPEAPDCEMLDAEMAATAAGLDVDVTDLDGTGTFDLPGLSTTSCSYGNGTMTLSTLSFNSLESITNFYLDNLDGQSGTPGEVLDVDLGVLAPSTLVTVVDGRMTVSVFEASVPFSVAFSDADVDAADAVAAAEAVLSVQVPTNESTSTG